MRLYRAVCWAEFEDIQLRRVFRPVASSMEGKWFAEKLEDAREWGQRFYQPNELPFSIVYVDIPDQLAEQMFRTANLDGIGPARWADLDLLNLINQKIGAIMVVK
jgi:hypothetical protein